MLKLINASDWYDRVLRNAGPGDPDNPSQPVRTVVPCVMFGSSDFEYLINDSPYQTGAFMTVWSISDPVDDPSLLGINVPVVASPGFPLNADQLAGSTTLIEVGNDRCVCNAVHMNGSIWTAHSVPGGQKTMQSPVTGFQRLPLLRM